MTNEDIKALAAKVADAGTRHERAVRAKQEETGRLLAVERERIDRLMADKHDDAIAAANKRYAACKDEHLTALEAHALAGIGAPHPLGTKLIEWSTRSNYGRSGATKTGKVGRLEAFTRQSEAPDGVIHSRPGVGDYAVRILKKDGTPSKNVLVWKPWYTREWLPEGWDPNEQK